MKVSVYIGGTVGALVETTEGTFLLRKLPSFAPAEEGVHTLETTMLPDELREEVEAEVRDLMIVPEAETTATE